MLDIVCLRRRQSLQLPPPLKSNEKMTEKQSFVIHSHLLTFPLHFSSFKSFKENIIFDIKMMVVRICC